MKPIVYIDMDDVICNYTEAHRRALSRNPENHYPQSQFDFFRKLKPIYGALEGIQVLDQNNYQIYILTAPSENNPLSYTEKRIWIEEYLGFDFVSKLIICSNKSLLKGDYLVDDHKSGKGQENFEGRILHYGSKQCKNWETVIKILLAENRLQ
ncbi:hypothetical protein U6A24_02605 [Aquimarina gracilis]|uniref:Uncharacterized protein n=1 Tax=Aquimarina gracilis TaxID=874422 RepID=A0ABU5ZRA9_9FLAO|nr:hypothetical protein [Aquimarina gracilis]MEB3344331.1 hypothetical protein [Aquimarina gracilis]